MANRLKVCNVDEEGRFGGPERRIVLVAAALVEEGVDTHVVYPSLDSGEFAQHLASAGVPCSALDITRLSKEARILARYVARFVTEALLLASFLKKNGFDLVHVNGSYQFKVAIAARLARVPVVWHLNDTMMHTAVRKAFSWTAKRCASGFIVAGQRVHDYYLRGTDLELRLCMEINAPVDTDVFRPSGGGGSSDGTCTVATVSGLNPTKGVEYFVRMAAEVRERCPNVRFAVAGAELKSHASYSARIREMVADLGLDGEVIAFHGLVDDVPAFLRKADVCVFTSISEASPASVWEALSMGKAVVTTDVGSVRQHVVDGVSGYVVPIKDVKALGERVTLLLKDPMLRGRVGEAARKVACERLGIGDAARKHRDIYRRVVELRQAGA